MTARSAGRAADGKFTQKVAPHGPRPFNSQGTGWGGPARGSTPSEKKPRPAFEVGNEEGKKPRTYKPQGVQPPPGWSRAKAKEERVSLLVDNLYNLAMSASEETTRVSATNHALNRLEGMPVQKNLNVNADMRDMTDEDIQRRAERLRAKRASASGGRILEARVSE